MEETKMMEMLAQLSKEMRAGFEELSKKVDNNTILLESTDKNVKTLAEGLESFREQVNRQFEEVHDSLNNKTELIETAIRSHSADVNKLKEESKHIQAMLGEHEVSIRVLKNKIP